MSRYLDFADVKSAVPIEEAVRKLGLTLKQGNGQLRGVCPACPQAGARALVVTPSKGAFYCWGIKKGGDQITLAAHVRQIPAKDAAHLLMGDAPPVPESEGGKDNGSRTLQPLSYLETDHPAVEAVGFNPDDAKAIGIGYASKGLMRGTVAVPVRLPDGTLVGYIGVTEAVLPPRFGPIPT